MILSEIDAVSHIMSVVQIGTTLVIHHSGGNKDGESFITIKDHRHKIQWALNKHRRHINYRVKTVGPGKYNATYGSKRAHFLLMAQYYSYDINISKESVVVKSTTPLGGFLSGGFIGMHRNHDETNAVRRRLHAAFPTRSINGNHV